MSYALSARTRPPARTRSPIGMHAASATEPQAQRVLWLRQIQRVITVLEGSSGAGWAARWLGQTMSGNGRDSANNNDIVRRNY